MTSTSVSHDVVSCHINTESDYGSDFGTDDEAAISTLLSQADSQSPNLLGAPILESIENDSYLPRAVLAYPSSVPAQRSRQRYVDEDGVSFDVLAYDGSTRAASIEVEYDHRNRVSFSPRSTVLGEGDATVPAPPEAEEPDIQAGRSPIQRFRTSPKKPLSVTDMVSPAWCELQYWYSLTKHGKVRKTPAMKQGSSVHKVLEEQVNTALPVATINALVQKVFEEQLKTTVPADVVTKIVKKAMAKEKRPAVPVDVVGGLVHKVLEKEKLAPIPVGLVSESVHKALGEQVRTMVPIDVESREDAFGLRLWNIIQSLRTLRATGLTREVEVWAVIEGQVINGVIDELSYDCPDDELEAKITEQKQSKIGKGKRQKTLPESQRTMDMFLTGSATSLEDSNAWLGAAHESGRKIYLTDVKTRGSRRMPSGDVSLHPTAMQLMMYHRMLSLMASNSVSADMVFARYRLDAEGTFSDSFIAQIASLDFGFHGESVQDSSVLFESEQDAVDEIIAHNTLNKLWILMTSELARAIPFSNSSEALSPMGDVLRAEYRASGSGAVIGSKTFAYDAAVLDEYLAQQMAWWKGERPPRGVDIEEAFKCRICEFAERCSWRKGKVDEGLNKARLRKEQRIRSEV
ncbi:hypothetical protein MBLNU459_g2719t1 [Dothideomycetes sp. NU459]